MTQYVFDNYGVAHAFASGNQDNARSHNGNFFFSGDTLYSYGSHFPVVHLDRANQIAYFNADQSSVTTEGKHKNAARRALRHFESVYLPALDKLTRGGFCTLTRGDLAKYIQNIADDIKSLEDKRSRMRSEWRKSNNIAECDSLRNAAQTVWKLHKRRGDCFNVADRDTKKERDERIKRDLVKRRQNIQYRIERSDDVLAGLTYTGRADVFGYQQHLRALQSTLDGLYPSTGFTGLADPYTRKNAIRIMGKTWVEYVESELRDKLYAICEDTIEPAIRDAIAKYETIVNDLIKADLREWQNGGQLPSGARNLSTIYLRVCDDELQTTHGARVPLNDAIELTRAAIVCRKRGKEWQRNGEKKPVGMFQTDRITKNGDLIVGCHRINWAQIVDCVMLFVPQLQSEIQGE